MEGLSDCSGRQPHADSAGTLIELPEKPCSSAVAGVTLAPVGLLSVTMWPR